MQTDHVYTTPAPIEEVSRTAGPVAAVVLALYSTAAGTLHNARVAELLGVSVRTVAYARKALIEHGWVTSRRRAPACEVQPVAHEPTTQVQPVALSTPQQVQPIALVAPEEVQPIALSTPLACDAPARAFLDLLDLDTSYLGRDVDPDLLDLVPANHDREIPPTTFRSASLRSQIGAVRKGKGRGMTKRQAALFDDAISNSTVKHEPFAPGAIERVVEAHRVAFELVEAIPITKGVRGVIARALTAHGEERVMLAIVGASRDRYVREQRCGDLGFMLADDPKRQNLAKYAVAGARPAPAPTAKLSTMPERGAATPDADAHFRATAGRFFDEMMSDVGLGSGSALPPPPRGSQTPSRR